MCERGMPVRGFRIADADDVVRAGFHHVLQLHHGLCRRGGHLGIVRGGCALAFAGGERRAGGKDEDGGDAGGAHGLEQVASESDTQFRLANGS